METEQNERQKNERWNKNIPSWGSMIKKWRGSASKEMERKLYMMRGFDVDDIDRG